MIWVCRFSHIWSHYRHCLVVKTNDKYYRYKSQHPLVCFLTLVFWYHQRYMSQMSIMLWIITNLAQYKDNPQKLGLGENLYLVLVLVSDIYISDIVNFLLWYSIYFIMIRRHLYPFVSWAVSSWQFEQCCSCRAWMMTYWMTLQSGDIFTELTSSWQQRYSKSLKCWTNPHQL